MGGWVVPSRERGGPGEGPGAARSHPAGGDGDRCREPGGSWREPGSPR